MISRLSVEMVTVKRRLQWIRCSEDRESASVQPASLKELAAILGRAGDDAEGAGVCRHPVRSAFEVGERPTSTAAHPPMEALGPRLSRLL